MSLFNKKDKTKTKRLGGGSKKGGGGGFFKRRKNQNAAAAPKNMDSIATPNVHDLPPRHEEEAEEEEVVPNKPKSKKEEWEEQFAGKYNYVCDIGAGAFGKVVKATSALSAKQQAARPLASDTQNANKKIAEQYYAIKLVDKIFTSTAKAKRFLREIRILRLLAQHEAIVELIDLIPPPNPLKFTKLCIVFEYMPTDLKKIFRSKQYFSNLHIEYILYQMLLGLKFVHSAGIVHRDLKPENIIINEECTVRICDFGLARGVEENLDMQSKDIHPKSAEILGLADDKDKDKEQEQENDDGKEKEANDDGKDKEEEDEAKKLKKKKMKNVLTKHVVTRWYRAPEVILLQQDRKHLYGIDVWSIGCIFGELLQMHHKNCHDFKERKVLFPGKTCFPFSTKDPFDYQHRTDQLRVVFDVIGTPQKDEISKFTDQNVQIYLNNMQKSQAIDLTKMFPATKKSGIDLLKAMITFDVDKRITVEEALKSPYFDDVRDEQAEARHPKVESFEYEDIDIDEMKLRTLILDEIMYFNPDWKQKLKEQYIQKTNKLKQLHSQNK